MKHKHDSSWKLLLITILVFVLLIGVAIKLSDSFKRTSDDELLSIVEESLHHALMTCYAVEGGYPEQLQYLKDHYGLMYDTDKIAVYYDVFASNIMPDIRVALRGADAQ